MALFPPAGFAGGWQLVGGSEDPVRSMVRSHVVAGGCVTGRCRASCRCGPGLSYGVMTSRNPRVWKAWSGLFLTREAERQYRE